MPILDYSKGQAQSSTVFIILAVAVLVGLVVIYLGTAKTVNAATMVDACHFSVMHSSWELKSDLWVTDWTAIESPFSFNCKTLVTEITKDDIIRPGLPETLPESNPERQDALKALVIDQMRECWYMYGEGRAKLQQAVTVKDDTVCLVCSEIVPDADIRKDPPELTGLYAYAKETEVPSLVEDSGRKSYLDYFLEGSSQKGIDVQKIDEGKKVVLDKQYSIVFSITDETGGKGAAIWFGGSIKENSGIVDCNIGGTGGIADEDYLEDIGCNSENNKPFPGVKAGENPGLIFGRVIDGGQNVELESWRATAPGGSPVELKRFPMTVRLVPTRELSNNCNRLY